MKQYRALLLDLDGTLLEIDMKEFIPAYIQALAPYFAGIVSPENFARHLLKATEEMIQSRNPDRANEDIFFDSFCRLLEKPYETIRPILDRFYMEEYPRLKRWSRPHPAADTVVNTAKRRNLILVLATNPVFPLVAIEQRLSWGGLKSEDFNLITAIENMHFCKPRPEYYLEIAEKIGCKPGQCLMAGNDVLEDLAAADAAMDTYLVEDFILNRDGVVPVYDYRGRLQELVTFIEQLP